MRFVARNNDGYKWIRNNNVSFKGYIQRRESGKVYDSLNAAVLFENVMSIEMLTEFLQMYEGVFAVVIELNNGDVLAAVDRSRSMPLYYSSQLEIISDSAQAIISSNPEYNFEIDEDQYLSLFASDYTFGQHTVYKNIKQLDLGEAVYLCSRRMPIVKSYYTHIKNIEVKTDEQYIEKLNLVSKNVFERLKKVIADRPVVLSMSGGYDSRFVGCMLKKVGVKDVTCYTYGKKDSFEVVQSKKNAEALGFEWTCIEYTDEDVKCIMDEKGMAYLFSYGGHDFTAYVQNYPAVRKLQEKGFLKQNSVFITGLCGDMPTGNYILPYDKNFKYNAETAAERLYNLIFTRFKMSSEFKTRWLDEVKLKIEGLPIKIDSYQAWVSAVDCIYTGTCHSHWFMHMNTVHSFFGYEWLLPYWDSELLDTWYSIPAEKRIGQSLYEKWLLNDVCSEYGIGQKKYRATYSSNELIRKAKYLIGSILAFICLNIGVPFKRKYDYNNFAPLELLLFKALDSKKTVIYRKAGLPLLMNQFLLQKRYGMEIMKKIQKKVKPTL